MASTQEPWTPTPVPNLTTRNSPQFNPALGVLSRRDLRLNAEQFHLSSDVNSDPTSAFVQEPQHLSRASTAPGMPMSAGMSLIEPQYDLNFLSPSAEVGLSSSSARRSGVNPAQRQALGHAEVPSLDDQERSIKLEGELAKVRSWLATSTLSGDSTPQPLRAGRGRSATAPSQQFLSVQEAQGPTGNTQRLQQPVQPSVPPSPGVILRGNDEELDESFMFGESTTPPAPFNERLDDDAPVNNIHEALEPWTDFPQDIDSARIKEQPPSSNAAITIFLRKAKDLETASLAATLGSRRRSETDLSSLFSREADANMSKSPSRLRQLFPSRNRSNSKKRKDSQEEVFTPPEIVAPAPTRRDNQGALAPLKRVISNPRSKSPRLETNSEQQPGHSPTIRSRGMSVIKRMRSKSDLAEPTSHIAEQWRLTAGGPPVPNLRSQDGESVQAENTPLPHPETQKTNLDEHDDAADDGPPVTMSIRAEEAPFAATREAFRAHAQALNPRIQPYMLDRLIQEQDKRFRRLMDHRSKHEDHVKRGSCPSGTRCGALGGGPTYLEPPTDRSTDSASPIFFITMSPDVENNPEMGEKASFPDGIPLPPVDRLPAEFECPLCFSVKKIFKPSDWTKHVNEDIQPFTCTFPNCGEAKSFKRKADWVRHESERHRHLEAWQCDLDGCFHRCYRRDNFVQHLVREHRVPEPQMRLTKMSVRGGPQPYDGREVIAQHVERCRQESTKRPSDEPCRFCGNICDSWKKLSVHLALHMQQISMPILRLLDIEVVGSIDPRSSATSSRSASGREPTYSASPADARTPQLGSGSLSNRQSSISSTGQGELRRPPTWTVTDTSLPQGRMRALTAIPSPQGWLMQGTSKETSRYPVLEAPGNVQASNALGLSMDSEPARSMSMGQMSSLAPQAAHFGYSPMTPQTPNFGTQSPGFLAGGHFQAPASDQAYTYPPAWTSGEQSDSHTPHVMVSNITDRADWSTSPAQTSSGDFSGINHSGTIMDPAFGLGHGRFTDEPEQMQEGQYFDMCPNSTYGLPAASDGVFQATTYPPQFYPHQAPTSQS